MHCVPYERPAGKSYWPACNCVKILLHLYTDVNWSIIERCRVHPFWKQMRISFPSGKNKQIHLVVFVNYIPVLFRPCFRTLWWDLYQTTAGMEEKNIKYKKNKSSDKKRKGALLVAWNAAAEESEALPTWQTPKSEDRLNVFPRPCI